MSGHTPAPWEFHAGGQGQILPWVQRGRSGGFLVQDTDIDRAHADARLIATSPRLFQSLFDLLVVLGQVELTPAQMKMVNAACEEASAALIEAGSMMG
jgi:hypothetical protein